MVGLSNHEMHCDGTAGAPVEGVRHGHDILECEVPREHLFRAARLAVCYHRLVRARKVHAHLGA